MKCAKDWAALSAPHRLAECDAPSVSEEVQRCVLTPVWAGSRTAGTAKPLKTPASDVDFRSTGMPSIRTKKFAFFGFRNQTVTRRKQQPFAPISAQRVRLS